jgi:hypothetical protein
MNRVPFVYSLGQFTRPSDTTQYTAGDLVANSTTAASVVPLSWSGLMSGGKPITLEIVRAKVRTNHTTLTNGVFRVHIHEDSPGTPSNGDNGAHRVNTINDRGYIEVTLTNVGATGQFGSAVATQPLIVTPVGGTLYVTIEANGAYTPASAETFRVDLEGYLNFE